LNEKGDLDGAIAEFRKATDLDPNVGGFHLNLGVALQKKGKLDEAIDEYRKASNLWPDDANPHRALVTALLEEGRFAEARTATRRWLELLPERDPLRPQVSRQLQQCEALARLDDKLPGILSGKEQPASTQERVGYAEVCRMKRLYGAGAKLYRE